MTDDPRDTSRRDLLRAGAVLGLGAAAGLAARDADAARRGPAHPGFKAPPLDVVRVGFVGVGGMGSAHVESFLAIEGVEVVAVCDVVPEKVERMQKLCADAGRPRPAGYSRGPRDFERLCERADLDLVLTATPWEWHVPVCLAAMSAGKHAATEVPAAMTLSRRSCRPSGRRAGSRICC